MPPIGRPPASSKPGSRTAAAVVLRVPASASACERARKLAGRTLDAADAPKLPFLDCGRVDCQCRYEAVADRRRRPRRDDAERREVIRFETQDGRRNSTDRRKRNNVWDKR